MTSYGVTSKARIWPQKHRSGNVTWKVRVGKKNDGKDDIRSFDTEAQATHFRDEWNATLIKQNRSGLEDLSALNRAEALTALEKLKPFNATLLEAVDFFIKFARPESGTVTVDKAVEMFIEAKVRVQRREAYVRNCRKTFYEPFARAFPNRNLSEISVIEAEKYIHGHRRWSASTIASHIGYLRTFYQFFISKGFAKLNPFSAIEKPRCVSTNPKVMLPEDARKLLQFAFDEGRKPECATMALVFFCGVRVEEAGRLNWSDINLSRRTVTIGHEQSKTAHRRVNEISDNAYEWLNLCASQGRVAPQNFVERLKRLRKKSGIPYPQNAMRHSFASYHIVKHESADKTAVLLGHPNPTLLYRTYRESVAPENADAYWAILPASVNAAREAKRQQQDEAAREEAESQSNVGEAVRGDNGNWIPVQQYEPENRTMLESQS